MYVSKDLITGDVAKGKYLVADESNGGMVKVVDTADGYSIALLVTEPLVTAQGTIYLCDVITGTTV